MYLTEATHFYDPETGARYPLDVARWCSDTGGYLMVEPLAGISKDEIDTRVKSLWRYKAALPLDIPNPVTLGEGCTPLVEKKFRGKSALFKLEWFSPTCSFKDKGASVMVSYLKHLGVPAILEDSSGNGGAAISAYGAAAGMKVRILTPAHAQPAKIAQMRIFGAEVQLVPGPRDATEREALKQADEIFYASHNWHPFFLEGTKMTAYELWEDLNFKAPDNVIVPAGAGSNIMGCGLGFAELLAAGQIDKMPKIFGVQPANCAPIAKCFAAGVDELVETAISSTIAEGASIKFPVRLKPVLSAIRKSEGKMVTVAEDKIMAALLDLAEMGLFVEPTSTIAAAAIDQLLEAGDIKEHETTVVLLSGGGLKAASFITEYLSK